MFSPNTKGYLWLIAGAFLIIVFNASPVKAQDTLAFRKAIQLSIKGQYAEAENLCQALLKKDPNYTEAKILLGRLYSWDNKFDSSRSILQGVLKNNPDNPKVLKALINTELWSNHPDQALVYCKEGIRLYPNDEVFYIRKSKALIKLKKNDSAYEAIQQALKINPNNQEAIKIQNSLRQKANSRVTTPSNGVGISYFHDSFNKNYTPWDFVSVYLYHRGKIGAIQGDVSYANRFNQRGYQYGLSVYPRISSTTRAYLHGGYSKDSIFPTYNLGFSLYHKLMKNSEAELGIRYLHFILFPDPIWIYTGGIDLRYKKFYGVLKTYLTPQKAGLAQSYYLTLRYYLANPVNNLSLTLSSGLSPQDFFDPVFNKVNYYTTQSKRARLDINFGLFSSRTIMRTSFAYENRQYNNTNIRDRQRLTLGIGLERRF